MASLTIASLLSHFNNEIKSISRGENHYKSGHIISFVYEEGIVTGKVSASMKNKEYNVKIYLDDDLSIKNTHCECPKGLYKCSHAAALFIHGIHNLSRTDIPCHWTKKRAAKDSEVQSAEDLFPSKRPYKPLTREVDSEDRMWLQRQLQEHAPWAGLHWLMAPEPEPQTPDLYTLNKVLALISGTDAATKDRVCAFLEAATLTRQQIWEMADVSKGQGASEAWHLLRKGRLTASNFGHVLQSKRVTPTLIKRVLGGNCLDGVKAVQWGRQNEENGVKEFEKRLQVKVERTGVWLHCSGLLGASPDGLVGNDSVLEVKCPYTHREHNISQCLEDVSFCLESMEDSRLVMKKDHPYWHQVQGQLHLTGRSMCYFVVWTLQDLAIVHIQKDLSWAANVERLLTFFKQHMLPSLLDN